MPTPIDYLLAFLRVIVNCVDSDSMNVRIKSGGEFRFRDAGVPLLRKGSGIWESRHRS